MVSQNMKITSTIGPSNLLLDSYLKNADTNSKGYMNSYFHCSPTDT